MRCTLTAISITVLAIAAAPAEARWLRADTANFIIYSEGSDKSLRDFAEKVERLDAALRLRFGALKEPEENRLVIYLVPRAEDAARLHNGKGNSNIAGFYATHPEGTFAVSNREADSSGGYGLDGETTLFHEYAHHFMLRYAPGAYPAWFVEGFAEYFSTTDFTKDGRSQTGKPANHRAYGLLEMPRMPVRRLLLSTPGELKKADEVEVYYGRAWLLTHMLYSQEARAGQLAKYIAAINAGTDPELAATNAFGPLDQLDKDLNAYLSKSLLMRTSVQPIAFAGDIIIRALTPAEDAVLPLRVARLGAFGETDRLKAMRADLAKLAAKLGEDAGLWFERAALEANLDDESRDPAAMQLAVDRALALNPDHVHANVLRGQLLADAYDAKGDFSAAAWREVRKPITRANRLAPNDPWPLYAWYNSFVQQGVTPPQMAHAGLARAFELAPENVTVRVTYAFDLARKGSIDAAIKLAKTVAFDPHGGGAGKELLAELEGMRGRSADDEDSTRSADTGE